MIFLSATDYNDVLSVNFSSLLYASLLFLMILTIHWCHSVRMSCWITYYLIVMWLIKSLQSIFSRAWANLTCLMTARYSSCLHFVYSQSVLIVVSQFLSLCERSLKVGGWQSTYNCLLGWSQPVYNILKQPVHQSATAHVSNADHLHQEFWLNPWQCYVVLQV